MKKRRHIALVPMDKIAMLTVGKVYEVNSIRSNSQGVITDYLIRDDFNCDYIVRIGTYGEKFHEVFQYIDVLVPVDETESIYKTFIDLALDIDDKAMFYYYTDKLKELEGVKLVASMDNEGRR